MLLYRGVNPRLHEKLNGVLSPKINEAFTKQLKWDEGEWNTWYWDNTDKNAVVEHQLNQAGYPTSGISTTPIFERAMFYATHGGEYQEGYIYVIDSNKCLEFGVALYIVEEIVTLPSIPEDKEIILVAKGFGALPSEVIIEIRHHKIET